MPGLWSQVMEVRDAIAQLVRIAVGTLVLGLILLIADAAVHWCVWLVATAANPLGGV